MLPSRQEFKSKKLWITKLMMKGYSLGMGLICFQNPAWPRKFSQNWRYWYNVILRCQKVDKPANILGTETPAQTSRCRNVEPARHLDIERSECRDTEIWTLSRDIEPARQLWKSECWDVETSRRRNVKTSRRRTNFTLCRTNFERRASNQLHTGAFQGFLDTVAGCLYFRGW